MRKLLGIIIVLGLGIYIGMSNTGGLISSLHVPSQTVSEVVNKTSTLSRASDLNDEVESYGVEIGDTKQQVASKLGLNLKDLVGESYKYYPNPDKDTLWMIIIFDKQQKVASLDVPETKHGLQRYQFNYSDVLRVHPGRVWVDNHFEELVVMDDNVRLVYVFENSIKRIMVIRNSTKGEKFDTSDFAIPVPVSDDYTVWGKVDTDLNITWKATSSQKALSLQEAFPKFPQRLLH